MEPIISPWAIYWINVLGNLNNFAQTISCLSGLLLLICIPIYFCIDISKDIKDKAIRISKISIIVFGISGLLYVLIPAKNDMISMLVLSYITPDNINLVQDNMVDFVKRIMNIIQSGSN